MKRRIISLVVLAAVVVGIPAGAAEARDSGWNGTWDEIVSVVK
jgi:hypothetical protein